VPVKQTQDGSSSLPEQQVTKCSLRRSHNEGNCILFESEVKKPVKRLPAVLWVRFDCCGHVPAPLFTHRRVYAQQFRECRTQMASGRSVVRQFITATPVAASDHVVNLGRWAQASNNLPQSRLPLHPTASSLSAPANWFQAARSYRWRRPPILGRETTDEEWRTLVISRLAGVCFCRPK
jgi:hypothetical protein